MCNIPISPNLFTALTANQYIDKLYVFGSRATLDDDEFSDIDMTAIRLAPRTTRAKPSKVSLVLLRRTLFLRTIMKSPDRFS